MEKILNLYFLKISIVAIYLSLHFFQKTASKKRAATKIPIVQLPQSFAAKNTGSASILPRTVKNQILVIQYKIKGGTNHRKDGCKNKEDLDAKSLIYRIKTITLI
jgi:hypothetical protein